MSISVFNENLPHEKGACAPRHSLFAASMACYLIGVTGLLALILAFAGLVPVGHLLVFSGSDSISCLINFGLLVLFALQHSVMARKSYKAWSARHIHPALERAMYVLASGIAILIMVLLWQPVGDVVWTFSGTSKLVVWAAFAAGWGYLFAATFAINHFDLFGLRQAWFAAQNRPYEEVPFKENWMYRYSRHPIMLGALIGIWFAPEMTGSLLYLAAGLTVYIAIGLYFEERDLIAQWGDQYRAYKQRVGALITLPKGSK